MAPSAPLLARLAPLIPQLVQAWERNRREPPEVLKPAARPGGRHIATLVSLSLSGPGGVSEIAERLDITTAHASLVIGDLAKAGLVDREMHPDDRRRVIVSLSARAKPGVAEMYRRNAGPQERFIEELEPAEAELFVDQLARLVALMYDN